LTLSDEEDDLAKPRDVTQLHITQALLDAYHEMDDDDQDLFRPVVKKYLPKLGVITDHNKLYRVYQNFRMEVYETLQKKNMGHLINMGDNLSDNHKLLMVLHFATEAEKCIKAGGDKLSKMDWEQSSCIAFVKHDMASSLFRQYQRDVNGKNEEESRQLWEDNEDDIMKAIGTVDFRFIISEDKDKFNTEVKEFIDLFNTSMETINMIGSMNASFHYLYYHLRTGEEMSSIITSTHLFNNVYGGEINTDAKLVNVHGYIAHSECWLGGYIQNPINFDDALLSYFDSVINPAFAYVFKEVVGKEVLGLDNDEVLVLNTDMATRFGNGDLTPAERKKLAERLLKSRIEGGTTSGLMRQLAKELIVAIMTRDNVSVEDAAEMMGDEITKYKESKISSDEQNDNVSKAIKALTDHNDKKWNEDVVKLAKKLSKLYLGSITTGLIVNLARNIYKAIDKQPSEITDKDVTEQLESLKKQYNRRSNTDETEDSDVYKAFKKLMEHDEKKLQDMSSLVKSISSVMQLGAMQTLASKMFGEGEEQLPYGSDLQTITYKLESLYNNHKSERKVDQRDVLALAFKDLIEQQPSITEDFSTLANYIYKKAMSCNETYEHHVKQMEKYIEKYFFNIDTKKPVPGGRGPVVYVTQNDNKEYPGLEMWWSTITGYKQYKGNVPGKFGVKAEKDTDRRQELEKMGLKFDDLEDVSKVITKGRQDRFDANRTTNKTGGARKDRGRAFGRRS